MRPERAPRVPAVVTGILLLAVVAFGLVLRMEDPLSGPLAAEDPYTHVVFTKEVLERGYFGDSYHLGTGMYPPGIHAFSGGLLALGGPRLYDVAVWGPVALGVLAIVGMYALGNRLAGPIAGLAAALLTAVMPEHVFRTNLWAPTAFDLALVPAWLLLFHLAVTPRDDEPAGHPGWREPARLAAGVGFLLLAIPLAFLHPWVVPLFAAPAALYAALQAFRAHAPPRVTTVRLGWAAGLVVLATAFAMASRWDRSDTGFAGFLDQMGPLAALGALRMPAPVLFVALVAIFGALAAGLVLLVAWAGAANARIPRPVRAGVAMALAAVVLATLPLLTRDLPKHVEYFSQLQPGAVVLAMVGVGLALVAPTRTGDLGLSISLFLFPLTAINVFDSEFWPQRTVVYLGIGVALLAAGAVAWTFAQLGRLVASGRGARVAAPVAIVLSVLLVGGAVAAKPAATYPWYRLYSTQHFEGFERVADVLEGQDDAQVVVYSWEPALMVKTLADPSQARYSPDFFKGGERQKILDEDDEAPRYVLVDKVALQKTDVSFLNDGSRYDLVFQTADKGLRLYEVKG